MLQEQGPFKFYSETGSPRAEFISLQLFFAHFREELKNEKVPKILKGQKKAQRPDKAFWEPIIRHPDFIKLLENDGPDSQLVELAHDFPATDETKHSLDQTLNHLLNKALENDQLRPQEKMVAEVMVGVLYSWRKDPNKKFFIYGNLDEFDPAVASLFMLSTTSQGPVMNKIDCSVIHRQIKLSLVSVEQYIAILIGFWTRQSPVWKQVRAYLCDKADQMLAGFEDQAGQNFDNAVALSERCSQICGADYVAVIYQDGQTRVYPGELFHEDKILLQKYNVPRETGQIVGIPRPSLRRVISDSRKYRSAPMRSDQALLIYVSRWPTTCQNKQKVKVFVTPEQYLTANLPDDSLAWTE